MSNKPEYFASEIIGFGGTGTTGPTGPTGSTGAAGGPVGCTGPAGGRGAVPANVFFAESNTTGSGAQTLAWDNDIKNDSHYTLQNSDQEILINEPGLYLINYSVCIKNLSSAGTVAPNVALSLVGTSGDQIWCPRSPLIYDTTHNLITDSLTAYLTPGDALQLKQTDTDSNNWCFAPHSICIEYIAEFHPQTTALAMSTGNYCDSSDNSLLLNLANAWSVALWLAPGSNFGNVDWFKADRTDDITISRIGDGLQVTLTGTGGTKQWDWIDVVFGSDMWYQFVVTWDGTDIIAYANGRNLQDPDTKTSDDSITQADSVGTVKLEEDSFGAIHSALAWDVVLTGSAVNSLYNEGLGLEVDPMRCRGSYVQHENVQHYWRLGYMPRNASSTAGAGSLGGKDSGLADPKIHMTDFVGMSWNGSQTYMKTETFPGASFSTSIPMSGWAGYMPPQAHSYHIDDETGRFQTNQLSVGTGTDSWTWMIWVRPELGTETETIVQVIKDADNDDRIDFEARGADSTGRFRVTLWTFEGVLFKEYDWDSILATTTWVQIAVTWNGTDLRLWKDGVEQTSPTKTTDDAGVQGSQSRRIFVGGSNGAGRYQGWYHSLVAWAKPLPGSLITHLYDSGAEFNYNDVEVGDLQTDAAPQKEMPSSNAWRFNAGGQAVDDQYAVGPTMSSLLGATPSSFSFSGWFNLTDAPAQYTTLWGSASNWTNWDDGFGLYIEANEDLIFWVGVYTKKVTADIGALPLNEWIHIAGAYDGGTSITLWVNGVEFTNTDTIPATITSAGSLRMAGTGDITQVNAFFPGWLDEFTLYDDVLIREEARWMRLKGRYYGDSSASSSPGNEVLFYRFGDNPDDDPTLSTGQLTDSMASGTNHATPNGVSGTIGTYTIYSYFMGFLAQFMRFGVDLFSLAESDGTQGSGNVTREGNDPLYADAGLSTDNIEAEVP